jgi:hypothetical protein
MCLILPTAFLGGGLRQWLAPEHHCSTSSSSLRSRTSSSASVL